MMTGCFSEPLDIVRSFIIHLMGFVRSNFSVSKRFLSPPWLCSVPPSSSSA